MIADRRRRTSIAPPDDAEPVRRARSRNDRRDVGVRRHPLPRAGGHAFVEGFSADVCRISVANYVDLSTVIESELVPRHAPGRSLRRRAGVVVEPVTLEHGELARQAFLDFGKGRHKAGLNFGDCFSTRSPRRPAKPSVQGRRLRPDRHQGRMSRPSAPPELEQPGRAPLPARLAPLAETARDYARAATSPNTNRAYAADWRHFSAWARRQNLPALPPDPQVLGLYIAACASGAAGPKPARSAPSSGACRR